MFDEDDGKTWQDRWEEVAHAERVAFEQMTPAQLLAFIRSGRVGLYYGVWSVIARVGTLEQFGLAMFDVLEKSTDFLVRFHAGENLGKLMGLPEKDPLIMDVILHQDAPPQDALRRLRQALAERLGEPEKR